VKLHRSLQCIVICALITSTGAGCKKRKVDADATGGMVQESSGKPTTALAVDPPKNLPSTTIPLPRPPAKPWASRTRQEKLVQLDFWLNQHQFGDATQQTAVAGEVRSASLSPAEQKELEEMRKRFGYRPISQ
jgi:hypothetical protein